MISSSDFIVLSFPIRNIHILISILKMYLTHYMMILTHKLFKQWIVTDKHTMYIVND